MSNKPNELEELKARLAELEAKQSELEHKQSQKSAELKAKFAPAIDFLKKYGLKTILPIAVLFIVFIVLVTTFVGVRGVYVSAEDPNSFYEFTASKYTYVGEDAFGQITEEGKWKLRNNKIILSVDDELFGKVSEDFSFSRRGNATIIIDGNEYNRVSLVKIKSAAKLKVSIDLQGGEAENYKESNKIALGSMITKPDTPVRQGYTFLGWYKAASAQDASEKQIDFEDRLWETTTIYARWAQNYTLTLDKNIAAAGTVSGEGIKAAGSNVYITAETNEGYTFMGWYNGSTKESSNLSYTFSMPEESTTYEARWYKLGVDKNIAAAGTVTTLTGKYNVGDSVTITAVTNEGYTFMGWYEGSTKISEDKNYNFTMPTENTTYQARWYKLGVDKNIVDAGTVTTLTGKYNVGDSVTLTAVTNEGYTWLGWYEGSTKISEDKSYTFTMPTNKATYEARWYKLGVDKNIAAAGTVTTLTGKYNVGDSVTLTAVTNEGYTWIGWHEGSTKVSENKSYTFNMPTKKATYEARWYKLGVDKNIAAAGTVTTLTGKYNVGDSVTITAETNPGYTWLGWYEGKTKISEDTSLSYTFNMPTKKATYEARWSKLDLQKNITEAGTITNLTGKYNIGDSVTITAETNPGYTWLGWYDGDTKVSTGTSLTYTFTMPYESKVYEARWEWIGQEDYTTIGYYLIDNYIWFGEYPQSIKADNVTVGTTADSRGYYLGSDGNYYAKVTATPYSSGYKFSTDTTVVSGTIYYFKVEPIKWRILSESNGEALILCESILANKRYHASSNNYMNSEIRAWLNNGFYNTAFNALQQQLIQVTNVDNSVYSTGYNPNDYACANTNDKIFLPSYREMVNTAYGFSSSYSDYDTARRRLTSDYSRATGAWMSTESRYYGNGWWWLRSPNLNYSDYARDIGYDGNVSDYIYVNYTRGGVVPALKIQLS